MFAKEEVEESEKQSLWRLWTRRSWAKVRASRADGSQEAFVVGVRLDLGRGLAMNIRATIQIPPNRHTFTECISFCIQLQQRQSQYSSLNTLGRRSLELKNEVRIIANTEEINAVLESVRRYDRICERSSADDVIHIQASHSNVGEYWRDTKASPSSNTPQLATTT